MMEVRKAKGQAFESKRLSIDWRKPSDAFEVLHDTRNTRNIHGISQIVPADFVHLIPSSIGFKLKSFKSKASIRLNLATSLNFKNNNLEKFTLLISHTLQLPAARIRSADGAPVDLT